METEQTTGSCPAPGQLAVKTWHFSSTRGVSRPLSDAASRFHGDGVRYKAKLIGVDPVTDSQGEKMCWDSMMKLKGFEAAARKQGKHKQRVWLKVFSTGLKILDERSGAVLHDHDRSRISSLTKDKSDPRALAYIYQHQDTYSLFYIKMANLADPVLADIMEVCQRVDQDAPQKPAEEPTQVSSFEDVFSPRPDPPPGQANQVSSTNELMEVFSIQMKEPLSPTQSLYSSQPDSPQPTLSSSQILSMFPTQPLGSTHYSFSPFSATAMPWRQANQWAAPVMTPWPNMPGSTAASTPAGVTTLPTGSHFEANGPLTSQPEVMWQWGGTHTSPTTASGYPYPVNSNTAPAGATGSLQSATPSLDFNLLM